MAGFAYRSLWNAGDLDRTDACGFYYLSPLFDISGNELAKLIRRCCVSLQSQIIKPGLNLRLSQARVDLSIEHIDDLTWNVLWPRKACPAFKFEVGHRLGYGRNIRQR